MMLKAARVIIAGGGASGCSIAYHFAKRGWKDVLLLEKGKLTCGTTFHAAGLVGSFKAVPSEREYILYGIKLYRDILTKETGMETGYKDCGSLLLARHDDRMIQFERTLANLKAVGRAGEILSPVEIASKYPLINTSGIVGGAYIAGDGTVNPSDLVMAYAKYAKNQGVKIIEGTGVEDVKVDSKNRVTEVVTSDGQHIPCEFFINATGFYSKALASKLGISLPLHPFEHYAMITKPFGVSSNLPVIRDYDGQTYIREWSGGLFIGGFEHNPIPCFVKKIPDKFEFELFDENWDQFHEILKCGSQRINGLNEVGIRQLICGPESFTPDNSTLMGPVPNIKNYYVLAGQNSHGIALSAGSGRDLVDWVIDGYPHSNAWRVDVQRFLREHSNSVFLRNRIKEIIPSIYEIPYPRGEYTLGRNLIQSSLHERLQLSGAVFGVHGGFERANFFAKHHNDFDTIRTISKGTFTKPGWFDLVRSEYFVAKQNVVLMDMSSFSKFEVQGENAEKFLQWICYSDVNLPIGHLTHSGILNKRGGYEADVMIIRIEANKFMLIGPTMVRTKLFNLLRSLAPTDVAVNDVTLFFTAINVMGPNAERVLSELTTSPLDTESFKALTCQTMDVAFASNVHVLRLTHTGEQGFTLYVPAGQGLHVYDSLLDAGREYQISPCGYYALRTLRMEKFMPVWGTDFNSFTTPYHLGREKKVKNNIDFIGSEALQALATKQLSERLCLLTLEDHNNEEDIWVWGGEPILKSGKLCGYVTSSAYSYSLDKLICLARVFDKDNSINNAFVKSSEFVVDAGRGKFAASLSLYPLKLPFSSSGNLLGGFKDICSKSWMDDVN